MQLGGFAIAAALERAGVAPEDVDDVLDGPGPPGGPGPDHRASGGGRGGHPDVGARDDDQQGLPLGAEHHLPRGPAHPRRRGRRRRRRRHGVDDQGAAPPARRARGVPARRRHARRLDDVRRADLRVRPLRDGPGHRAPQRRAHQPRARRTPSARRATSKAAAAIKNGLFAEEIVAVEVPQRKGDPLVVDTDEGVRPGTTAESLGALRPAFDPAGTITAGNASQISDGGAAVVVMSAARARPPACPPLGELVAYGQVAGPDASLLSQPAQRDPRRDRQGRAHGRRPRPHRDQRGLRRGGTAVRRRARSR